MMDDRSPGEIRVLHVDDEPDFADLTATFLEREDDRFAVDIATSVSAGKKQLAQRQFDCVVSDYDMPSATGIEFLRSVREDDPDLPFILFTGKGSEEVASDAISAGVTDYLQKEGGADQYAVLANRITNAVEHRRAQKRVERSEQRLREIVDALPHLLYVVDRDGNYLLANEALAAFHNTTVAEIEGANVVDVLGESAANQLYADIENVLETGTPQRLSGIEMDDPDGETHIFEPRMQPYEFGAVDDRAILGIAVDVSERETRERALDRTRERMELALERTDSVIFDINFETGAVRRHGPYEQFFEVDPDDLPTWQEHCETVVHPDDREAFREFHREILDGRRQSGEIEYRTNPENGNSRWIRAHVSVTDETESDQLRGLGISRDITEQKEYERELEQTNSLLSTLFDTLPVGVLAEDENRDVVAINEQLFELFNLGGGPDDVRGTDCVQLATDVSEMFADAEAFVDRIDQVIAEQEPVYNEELTLADGQTYARSYHPIELPSGDGHLWVYRNITARKTRETRLAALNKTTQELIVAETRREVAEIGVEAAAEILGLEASAIHLSDDRDRLVPVAVTDAGRRLIGDPPTLTGDESIAWRVYEQGDARAIEDVHDDPNIYNPDSPVRSELILPIGEAGVLIAGSPTAATFDDEDRVLGEILAGNIAAALEQVERTAEMRARETELAQQNERLEEFASVVSHDLRNPLRVAEGQLELLKEECEATQVNAIESALDRMDALIEDILTLAREDDSVSEMETVDVGETSKACWNHVETAEATLDITTDKTIRADRSRLQQLLENLIRNAVEHGSGDVTVTVGALDTGFYVADDGPGIPADERESVFDTGYSTAADGTGFGLSIVRQIADAHGWTITLTESETGGARFEITGVQTA
jgi:PAS domain S-box-containing protein